LGGLFPLLLDGVVSFFFSAGTFPFFPLFESSFALATRLKRYPFMAYKFRLPGSAGALFLFDIFFFSEEVRFSLTSLRANCVPPLRFF